jgi:hypothetical protein
VVVCGGRGELRQALAAGRRKRARPRLGARRSSDLDAGSYHLSLKIATVVG